MSHLSDEQLILHYYGESRERSAEEHLSGCEACREQYRSLQRVLNIVDGYPVPERDAQYGAAVWQRIESRLEVRRRPAFNWLGWLGEPKPWAAAAMLTVLLFAAFYAGRVSTNRQSVPATVAGLTAGTGERVLLSAVANHLERSHLLLAELANTHEDDEYRPPLDDVHELLIANRLYRQSAAIEGERAIADVLEELERLLTELAHANPESTGRLRHVMVNDDILFKVRVTGAEVRARELSLDRDPGSASL